VSELSCSTPRSIALSQLKPGQGGIVRSMDLRGAANAHAHGSDAGPDSARSSAIDAARDAAYLGAMGMCCNAKVRLCRAGEPCIVSIVSGSGASCRIGLARPLADRIMVEPEAGVAAH